MRYLNKSGGSKQKQTTALHQGWKWAFIESVHERTGHSTCYLTDFFQTFTVYLLRVVVNIPSQTLIFSPGRRRCAHSDCVASLS